MGELLTADRNQYRDLFDNRSSISESVLYLLVDV